MNNGEQFQNIPPPSVEEETDPTIFSPLPLTEVTEDGVVPGYEYPIVKSGGSRYVELRKNKGANSGGTEKLISRVFKGIINVSDVVEGTGALKGRFFSKIMPLEIIEKESSDDEISADIYLIQALTGDGEKTYPNRENQQYGWRQEKGKVAYYDFDGGHGAFLQDNVYAAHRLRFFTENGLRIAEKKVSELARRLTGSEGFLFIRSNLRDMDILALAPSSSVRQETSPEGIAEKIQSLLLKKAEKMKSDIQQEIDRRSEKAV